MRIGRGEEGAGVRLDSESEGADIGSGYVYAFRHSTSFVSSFSFFVAPFFRGRTYGRWYPFSTCFLFFLFSYLHGTYFCPDTNH